MSGDDSKQSDGRGGDSLGWSEPDYDISDVRRALRELLQEVRAQQAAQKGEVDEASLNAAYCAVLSTLSKVATNLLRSPANPLHLRINLRSGAVLAKFGSYAGARALLRFLGFQERVSVESHALEVEAAALPALRTRIERAVVLIAKVKDEHAPPHQAEREEMSDVSGSGNGSASAAMDEEPSGSVVAAPSSVFLANAEADESGEGAFRSSASPSPPPDEEMRPDLAPSYAIGDVRAALNQLYSDVEASLPLHAAAAADLSQSGSDPAAPARATPFQQQLHRLGVRDAYCAVLDTLAKVASNLLRTPPSPAHLRINLANATVYKRFAQFPGALLFLRFLGFKEAAADAAAGGAAQSADADAAAPVTPSSGDAQSQPQQLLVLPEADLARDSVKISRALTILQKARSDAAPTPAENEQRALGPVDRALRLFDLNVPAAEPARSAGAAAAGHGLPFPAEEDSDAGRADLALLMAAAAAERKRVHELSRTDVIVTKQKQAEIREASKRRYHSTLVKVTFTDKSAVQAPQGQGRYGPAEGRTAGGGYRLGLKANYGAPPAVPVSPPAANVPGGPEPMDEEGDEKQGAPLPVAQPVAMPVSPAAAASVTVSPPPAPAPAVPAAPAAEVMLSAYFRPWETLGDLFAFLQSQLVDAARGRPFYLHLPPNVKFQCGGDDRQGRHADLAGKSLQSLGLVPAAAMIFHYCADAAPNASAASASAPAPAAAAAGGVVSTLRAELLARREPYDAHALASLIPVAENKEQLEAQKAKLLADAKAAGGGGAAAGSKHAASSSGSASGSGSLSLGAHGSDDDDLDMEAYMRAKKKAALAGKSGLAGRSGGAASGSSSGSSASGSGSSSSAGSAASKRNIPGLFSQFCTRMRDADAVGGGFGCAPAATHAD